MTRQNIKKYLSIATISLLFLNFFPTTLSDSNLSLISKKYEYTYDKLDGDYIYNLTEALSNIIFTEYDEENGELAKGRAFGTKGEHKAAEILYENMTDLGLYTVKEQIHNTEDEPDLITELEIMDCHLKININTIDTYIAPVWFETTENNNNLNYTYNYTNLKVIDPPLIPGAYIATQRLLGKLEPFVIILKDRAYYPYNPLRNISFLNNWKFNFNVIRTLQGGLPLLYSWLWNQYLEYCKGIILYDFNEDCHNMNYLKYNNYIPFIYINGSDGKKILDDIENTRIDFKLEQRLNTSIVSYNVIGHLNGTDPSKTVVVSCFYDSWWCQGTADSAIGMAMAWAIAKYYVDNNITPKYNMKFIAFSGQEHGLIAGSRYYASAYDIEDVTHVIDLNQLCFWQDEPELKVNFVSNKLVFLAEIYRIVKDTNYVDRVNSSDDIKYVWIKDIGPGSNAKPFILKNPSCKGVTFVKDSGWKLHHRDGLNHTEGDVLKYYDPEDVDVTGEMVLNIIKYLTTEW
jgi:hypothetical protein